MTPEQEEKLDSALAKLGELKGSVHTLTDLVLRYEHRIAQVETKFAGLRRAQETLRLWVRRLIAEPGKPVDPRTRETLPSLSTIGGDADSSGSFELNVLGSAAKFHGPAGMRLAVAVLAAAALVAAGVFGAMAVHR